MSALIPYNTSNLSLFLPNQIGGLSLWLDAADSATVITTGTNVTKWNDKSLNKFNMSNNASYQSPTYNTTGFNGKPTISFVRNSSNSFSILENTTFSFSQNSFSLFFISQKTASDPVVYQRFFSAASTIGGQDYNTLNNFNVNSGVTNTSIDYEKNGKVIGIFTITNPFLGEVIVNGTVSPIGRYAAQTNYIYANGSPVNSSTSPPAGANFNTVHARLGSATYAPSTNDGNILSFNGNISEVLFFNRALTTSESQQIESYLAYKWGLQASLPSSHPYYGTPYNAYGSFTNINQIVKYPYPMSPSQIAGLSLWLDAADSSTLFQNTLGTIPVTNGSQIQLWKDKSSSVNNATNSQTGMTYTSSGLNGLPSISFPGTQATGFSLSGSLLPNGSANATYFFVLNKNNSITQVYFTHGGANQLKQFYSAGGLAIDRSGTPLIADGNGIVNLNIIVSCTETSLSAGVNGWINGKAFTNNGVVPSSWNVDTTAAWLGSGGILGTSFIYAGIISEVLVFNVALTTNQRQQIEGYLAWKWGLQASLPSTHPYFNNAFVPNMTQSVPMTITMYQYSPKSLSGLSLWLDAADGSSVTQVSGSVSKWSDKSGNAYSVTGASGSQPTYTTNTISFSGSQFFTTNYTSFPAAESIFIIINVLVNPSGEFNFLHPNQSGGRQLAISGAILTTNRTSLASLLVAGNLTPYSNIRTLIETTNSGTSLNHFINGLNVGSTGVAPYSGSGSTTTIGARSIGDRAITGSINEIVIFSSALTTNQMQAAEGYLSGKWGLQASLPSNHPYILYPP